jgi:hypothetical protein
MLRIKKLRQFFANGLFILSIIFCSQISLFAEQENTYPNISLTGFTQYWGKYNEKKGRDHGEDFSWPRARIGVKGDLNELIDYMFLSEWGRLTYDDPATLLDCWINFKVDPKLNIKLGQTWYKFSLSGTTPLPKIPFVFRPEVVDAIWLPMGRVGTYSYDRGIEVSGQDLTGDIPYGYTCSITAGSGLDHFEDNDKKDFSARIWIEPIEGLKIGSSGFYGWSKTKVSSNLNNSLISDISEYAYGYEASYQKDKFRVIGEYLQARYDDYYHTYAGETFTLAAQKPGGWYLMVGAKPTWWLEVPIRYASYKKNISQEDTELSTITFGLTWTLKKESLNNIKINYLIRDAEKNYGSKPENMSIVQIQLML